jgi:hypothetical protein
MENTPHLHYKDSWLRLFKEVITVYCENHAKPKNTLYWQTGEILNVKAGVVITIVL